jgi:aminopeptidase N
MRDAQPQAIYLKDYQVPEFLIDHTNLHFTLAEEKTLVLSRLTVRRNPDSTSRSKDLMLHGQDLLLLAIAINDVALGESDYELSDDSLLIKNVPDTFELQMDVEIKPQENTSLEGLYKSRTMFCTQCEAEGFRKITDSDTHLRAHET